MSDGEPDGGPDESVSDGAASEPETSEQREAGAGADSAPLSDLARRMDRERRERTEQTPDESATDFDAELSDAPPPDPDDDPFERMSVGEIDEDALWASLGADETPGGAVDVGATPEADTGSLGGAGPAPDAGSGGGPETREHVVPKKKYCQSCPYFHEPPEMACTHEGTEIVEAVDSDRFRVRNCPMVENGVEPQK